MHWLLLSFLIVLTPNALGYLNGFFRQSDRFTDLIYAMSFLFVAVFFYFTNEVTSWDTLLFTMILLWSVRLGIYLFSRIRKMGHDERFNEMRPSPIRLFGFWALQTISIWILILPVVYYLILETEQLPWHQSLYYAGTAIFAFGLLVETVADQQKFAFRNKPSNKGAFIQQGLWKRLRHPNYTGEILVWIGLFIYCIPVLQGMSWLLIASPLWITILLTSISGIPLLKKSTDKRYGHLESYQNYLKNSWKLIPYVY
jgi:steroid 5-alpha reductase family enzyme